MSLKVDPGLMKDLQKFGMKDASKCYHCGNCTATCPLAEKDNTFPRRMIKYAQMGLKDKIMQSPEPWLCYYCGDCSDQCPRGADPGEAMMAMRRYLTSRYDWTGFSRKFYTSHLFEIIAVVITAILIGLALWKFHLTPSFEHARLNSVWPADKVEIADLVMAFILTVLLLSNTYRCFSFMMGDLKFKVPLSIYIKKGKELVLHFLTQKRFGECSDRKQWFVHLMIMTGYCTVFLLVAVFLAGGLKVIGLAWEPISFQRDWDAHYRLWHPMRFLGYYATFAILYGTTYAIIGRIKKSKTPYKNSHATDWMFLILLELTTLTGIFIHLTILMDLPMTTYILYAVHLMVAIPMLVLEVPFAKWAHLAFRPVALYLIKVKEEYNRVLQAAQ
jgi:quinone-modifying oxidoreductase, subunit QmoC